MRCVLHDICAQSHEREWREGEEGRGGGGGEVSFLPSVRGRGGGGEREQWGRDESLFVHTHTCNVHTSSSQSHLSTCQVQLPCHIRRARTRGPAPLCSSGSIRTLLHRLGRLPRKRYSFLISHPPSVLLFRHSGFHETQPPLPPPPSTQAPSLQSQPTYLSACMAARFGQATRAGKARKG